MEEREQDFQQKLSVARSIVESHHKDVEWIKREVVSLVDKLEGASESMETLRGIRDQLSNEIHAGRTETWKDLMQHVLDFPSDRMRSTSESDTAENLSEDETKVLTVFSEFLQKVIRCLGPEDANLDLDDRAASMPQAEPERPTRRDLPNSRSPPRISVDANTLGRILSSLTQIRQQLDRLSARLPHIPGSTVVQSSSQGMSETHGANVVQAGRSDRQMNKANAVNTGHLPSTGTPGAPASDGGRGAVPTTASTNGPQEEMLRRVDSFNANENIFANPRPRAVDEEELAKIQGRLHRVLGYDPSSFRLVLPDYHCGKWGGNYTVGYDRPLEGRRGDWYYLREGTSESSDQSKAKAHFDLHGIGVAPRAPRASDLRQRARTFPGQKGDAIHKIRTVWVPFHPKEGPIQAPTNISNKNKSNDGTSAAPAATAATADAAAIPTTNDRASSQTNYTEGEEGSQQFPDRDNVAMQPPAPPPVGSPRTQRGGPSTQDQNPAYFQESTEGAGTDNQRPRPPMPKRAPKLGFQWLFDEKLWDWFQYTIPGPFRDSFADAEARGKAQADAESKGDAPFKYGLRRGRTGSVVPETRPVLDSQPESSAQGGRGRKRKIVAGKTESIPPTSQRSKEGFDAANSKKARQKKRKADTNIKLLDGSAAPRKKRRRDPEPGEEGDGPDGGMSILMVGVAPEIPTHDIATKEDKSNARKSILYSTANQAKSIKPLRKPDRGLESQSDGETLEQKLRASDVTTSSLPRKAVHWNKPVLSSVTEADEEKEQYDETDRKRGGAPEDTLQPKAKKPKTVRTQASSRIVGDSASQGSRIPGLADWDFTESRNKGLVQARQAGLISQRISQLPSSPRQQPRQQKATYESSGNIEEDPPVLSGGRQAALDDTQPLEDAGSTTATEVPSGRTSRLQLDAPVHGQFPPADGTTSPFQAGQSALYDKAAPDDQHSPGASPGAPESISSALSLPEEGDTLGEAYQNARDEQLDAGGSGQPVQDEQNAEVLEQMEQMGVDRRRSLELQTKARSSISERVAGLRRKNKGAKK